MGGKVLAYIHMLVECYFENGPLFEFFYFLLYFHKKIYTYMLQGGAWPPCLPFLRVGPVHAFRDSKIGRAPETEIDWYSRFY
jgi:hypothetical protein